MERLQAIYPAITAAPCWPTSSIRRCRTIAANPPSPAPASGRTPAAYFADPTGFGGQRRNQFSGPGYLDTDLALLKGFKLPRLESGKVQVGVQAYNILNHPNFQNPGFNFSAPGFGTVTQTASSPTSVFGSFLGGDSSPRILQLKATFQF